MMACGTDKLEENVTQFIRRLKYFVCFFIGWISCLLLVVALIFSKSLISITTNAMFSTIIHMTWSVIILWVIVASISKHRGTANEIRYIIQCLLAEAKL